MKIIINEEEQDVNTKYGNTEKILSVLKFESAATCGSA